MGDNLQQILQGSLQVPQDSLGVWGAEMHCHKPRLPLRATILASGQAPAPALHKPTSNQGPGRRRQDRSRPPLRLCLRPSPLDCPGFQLSLSQPWWEKVTGWKSDLSGAQSHPVLAAWVPCSRLLGCERGSFQGLSPWHRGQEEPRGDRAVLLTATADRD